MSRLEELLNKYCPDGVEYKQIKDIAEINRGIIISKKYIEENKGDYPVYSSQTENNGELGRINNYAYDGEYLTWTTDGANAGSVFYRNEKFNITNVCGLIKITEDNVITKFVYYILHIYAPKYVNRGMGNCKLMSNVMESISIPIPPIEVQKEIVRILDTFTKYQDLLNRELELRKKQYEYYRDKLLTFGDEVEYKTVGDVGLVTKLAGFEFTKYVTYSNKGKIIALRGLNVKNGRLNLDEVKYIDESDLTKLTRSKLYIDDMLFTYVGTIGEVALIDENDKYYLAPNVALLRFDTKLILPKFMIYYFQSKIFFNTQINKLLQSSSMKNIPMEKIRKFLVPIPPLEEQERIVKILDQFDTLCNDITNGLPAEIEMRKKQYEYYRDKLLTFKEKKK